MSHTIRPARPEEVDGVIGTLEWLFAPPGSQPALYVSERARAAVGRAIENPDATVLVAEAPDTGGLAGVCSVFLDVDSIRFGQRAWVEDLAVSPQGRSTGIGKALLDAAKNWARDHGAVRLGLESGEARLEAHRFYEREQPSSRSRAFSWQL